MSRALALALLATLGCSEPVRESRPAERPEWAFAFYMSYDNNLEIWQETISQQIADGTQNGSIVAAVQADLRDAAGMQRMVMRRGEMQVEHIASEDSADERTALDFLQWFVRTFDARRYAVVFLDHGGGMDEMCLDEHPGPSGRRWMSGQRLGAGLRELAPAMDGRLELLFLQQCGRGSLSNLHSFANTARWVMSSPLNVGAPNTYYAPVLSNLAREPDVNGRELCTAIAGADVDYRVYTCADGARLAAIPEELSAVAAPFRGREQRVLASELPALYAHRAESATDAVGFFSALSRQSRTGDAEVVRFTDFVHELMVDVHFQGNSRRELPETLSGASIFVPRTREDAARYGEHEAYRRSDLGSLFDSIVVEDAPH